MNQSEPTYQELKERLEQAEAILNALRRGETDLLVGGTEPMVVQFKSLVEEKARLFQEKERLASEWQTTFDAVQDAVWLLDAEQHILRTNQAAERLFGYPAQKMLGRHCCEIVHGTQEPIPPCPFRRMRKSLQRESMQMSFGNRWLDISTDPLFDSNHELIGCIHIASDITERKRRERALEAEAMLAKAVSEALELRPLLERLLQAARHAIPAAEKGSVLLAEEDGRLRIYALNGYTDARMNDFPFAGEAGYPTRAVRERQPLLISDVRADPGIRYDGEIEEARAIYSAITAPILLRERVIGALALESTRRSVFEQADLDFLTHFAATAALVIERARLFEKTQQQAEKMAAVNDLGRALAATLDLPTIYRRAYQHIRRLLDCDNFGITLYEEETHALRLAFLLSDGQVVNVSNVPALLIEPSTPHTGRAGAILDARPILLNDLAEKSRKEGGALVGNEREPESAAYTPMVVEGKVIGLLELQSYRNYAYQEKDIGLLQMLANQIGLTIQNAQLLTETRQRLKELETLQAVSSVLRQAHTVEEMIPLFIGYATRATNAGAGSIYLLEEASGDWVSQGWIDPNGCWISKRVELRHRPGEGVTGRVGKSGDFYITNDWRTDPVTCRLPGETVFLDGLTSGISLPLRAEERIIGVFHIWHRQPHTFDEAERRLLTAIADMAGNALQRARLNEETQQRIQQLQALHAIDRAISASLDARVAFNILLEHTVRQLKIDAAGILLFNPGLLALEYAAGRGFKSPHYERTFLPIGEGTTVPLVLERQTTSIPNLAASQPPFQRTELAKAEGFVFYAATPLIAKGQIKGILEVFHRSPKSATPEWLEFLEALAQQAAIAIENAQLFDYLQRANVELSLAYETTIEGWSSALDLRDKETEGHTQRVTALTLQLARAMGLPQEQLIHIRRGALLHDIGKMGVPDAILLKPGALTPAEWAIMRQHPQYAYEMLSAIEYLRPALDIPYCHHEKWDGSGYPRGLKGDEIPLAARIFAVADVWDALTSDRPYRKAWSKEEAHEYIRSQAGTHFDPQVVDHFLRIVV
ncbi:MAG: hypothetical protein Fur0043_12690 [Anaerolineales bacterium]